MSTLNPILAGSAQSVEAYQQVIEQTSQAVVQWLKQPEMYQGKSVDELRERISLEFNEQGLGNQAAIDRAIEYFLKDSLSVHHPQCVAHLHCPSLVISQAAEVLINATNQMEIANLQDDPDIDAILWIGYPGAYGHCRTHGYAAAVLHPAFQHHGRVSPGGCDLRRRRACGTVAL